MHDPRGDRMLYSPDILFIRDGKKKLADVITCAAPNFKAAGRYKMVSYEENLNVLEDRIKFIVSNLEGRELDTVILGAWGCGVFGQNPVDVANLFKRYSPYIDAKTVVFAVIGDDNFREFKRVCE